MPARWAIVVIVLLGAALRSWHLDAMSIWQDEALSLYRATKPLPFILSGRIIIGELVTQDVQPPLYFVLLAGWFRLLGTSTWLAKFLSLAAGLVSLPLLWALGHRWLGRPVAVTATGLAAMSPLYLWYSQEIRSYTLQVALALLALYGLVRALATPDRRRRGGWLLVSTAANAALLWTHYLGFFLLCFEALYLLTSLGCRGRLWIVPDRRLWIAALALACLALPLLPFALYRLRLGAETDQHFVALPVILGDVVHGFAFGWDPHPERLMWIDGLVLLTLVGGLVSQARRRPMAAAALAGLLLVPVLGLFGLTIVKPVYMGVRHILLASPAYFLLLGAGLWALRRRWPLVGLAVGGAIGLSLAASCWGFYHDPAYRKDDLRALAQHVQRWAVPGDVLAVSDPRLALAFEHLIDGPRLPVVAVPAMRADGRLDDRPPAAQLAGVLPRQARLWFMTPLPETKAWLEEMVAGQPHDGGRPVRVPARARLVATRAFPGRTIPVRVDAYEAYAPPEAELAAAKMAAAADWPMWWHVQPRPAVAGRALRLALYAPDLARPPATPGHLDDSPRPPPGAKLSLRLVDARGRVWSQADSELARHDYPAFDSYDLWVQPVVPPGFYTLSLQVYAPEGDDGWAAAQRATLGALEVAPAHEAPASRELAIGARLVARGAGLELLGYDLARRSWPAGSEMDVWLWLRAASLPVAADGVRLELVDRLGRQLVATEAALAAGNDSPAAWRTGDVRRVRLSLALPARAGRYGLRARLLAAGEPVWLWRGWLPVQRAWLGTVVVEALHPRRTPKPQQTVGALFGDNIRLQGYDLDQPPERWPELARQPAGATVAITLHWTSLAPAPANYAVSVQLVPMRLGANGLPEAAGPPLAQHDSQPAHGTRPCRGWLVGETVLDRHEVSLPPALPGEYLLIAVMYDPLAPESGRLRVTNDASQGDYAILASLASANQDARP